MKPVPMEALSICSRLAEWLSVADRTATVHSVFDRAVNIECDDRLIGVVAEPKSLEPFGLVLRTDRTPAECGVRAGEAVCLTHAEIQFANGFSVRIGDAQRKDLSVESIVTSNELNRSSLCLQPVLAVLRDGGETDGLSVLATGGRSNLYADFLLPRLPALFAAVEAGDAAAAADAATRIAGCGVGLTPSSDDLLTGYLLTLRLLSKFGRMRDVRAMLADIAAAAARKTNRISGAFLFYSGEGLASDDFLGLCRQMFFHADAIRLREAAARVAQFGSTSGRDMLTGLLLAIQHHDGGKNSGKTGDSEKRVL